MNTAAICRLANPDTRNRRIREAFYQRYFSMTRERKPDRDQVAAVPPAKRYPSTLVHRISFTLRFNADLIN